MAFALVALSSAVTFAHPNEQDELSQRDLGAILSKEVRIVHRDLMGLIESIQKIISFNITRAPATSTTATAITSQRPTTQKPRASSPGLVSSASVLDLE